MNKQRLLILVAHSIMLCAASMVSAETELPEEPVAIGYQPQLFVDDYIVDNRWPLKKVVEVMGRVAHQPDRHPDNPVIKGKGGYVNVVWDEDAELYRMLYQDFWYHNPPRYTYAIAYAESKDGIAWETPNLGLYEWRGSRNNNICWQSLETGIDGPRAAAPFLMELPPEHRKGHRFVMFYVSAQTGCHLVGSNDCIHWDKASDTNIAESFFPDTHSSIVWDPKRKEFVWYSRATDRYGDGDPLTRGATRRICRLSNKQLWTNWPVHTQNILIPDEGDATEESERAYEGSNYFYGMPARYYAGIYFGFLQPYKLRASSITTQLAISRNGRVFERFPGRSRLVELGPRDAWDDGMVFASPGWVEVGDEWRIYYCGTDGPHNSDKRVPGIGLATIRKEGFASLRGPEHGGVVCTRAIRWPGGRLLVNCDATTTGHVDHFGRKLEPNQGELKVRLTTASRKPIPGFDYKDSVPFNGDSTAHEVTWKGKQIDELKGQVVRIEFQLKMADLYSFRAAK